MAQERVTSASLPAHDAAAANDVPSLRKLFATASPAPPTNDDDGDTPLHSASREGADDAVDWLLKNTQINPECANKNRETAAHLAAGGGHLKCLTKLVNANPKRRNEVVSAADAQGLTPLHYATVKGKLKVMKWLLEKFGDSVIAQNENGQMSVHFAASSGNLPALKLLLQHSGMEAANRRDQNGTSPVYFAAQEGRLECLRYLIREAKADPLAKAGDGMTAVHAATQGGHFDTVKWLINKLGKEKMSQPSDEDGATPVHFAAATGRHEILKWFLETSESNLVSLRDVFRGTPGHDAAEYGHVECLKVLAEHSADLFALDNEGMSPYSLAIRDIESDVAQFMMNYAESSHNKYNEGGRSSRNSRQQNGENAEKSLQNEETIISHSSNGLPDQNKRLSGVSQTSMPISLADDATEIIEAKQEVEAAFQNSSLQHHRKVTLSGQKGVYTDNQSGSELDVTFSVENHQPGHHMPNAPQHMPRLDSRGMLKQSPQEHYVGPADGIYAVPQPSPLRQKKKLQRKLTETDDINNGYMNEKQGIKQQTIQERISVQSESQSAAIDTLHHIQPVSQQIHKIHSKQGGKWHDDHAWYDDPVTGSVAKQQLQHINPNRDFKKQSDVPKQGGKGPHEKIRQRHPENRLPPPWIRQQQRMHGEAWVERQPVYRIRQPPRHRHQLHSSVGPFDHEADVILIPRFVKRYPQLRVPHLRVDSPHIALDTHYPRTPSPPIPAIVSGQHPQGQQKDTKFSTLPGHIDYSRRPYNRMSHYYRAHPGHKSPNYKKQSTQQQKSGESLDNDFSSMTADGRPEVHNTPHNNKKNKGDQPKSISVSESDDVIVRNAKAYHSANRPRSEIIPSPSDQYHRQQRIYPVAIGNGIRAGPAFDPYRAQSMSAIDSFPDRRLGKRQEFSSHNEIMVRRRPYGVEDDMDGHYSVANALAYAAVAVLASVAGSHYRQQYMMMVPTNRQQYQRQTRLTVPRKGPGAMIAEAYETGSTVDNQPSESSVYFKSHHYPGQQMRNTYMTQEQRVIKDRKRKPVIQSSKVKKKDKKIIHKTSHSTTASELEPVPEDEYEYNYEMERKALSSWTEDDEDIKEMREINTMPAIYNTSDNHRVSGKDIREAYQTSKQNAWASMSTIPSSSQRNVQIQQWAIDNGPKMRTSKAAARVSSTGTHQLAVQSSHPRQHKVLATAQIHSRQLFVNRPAKTKSRRIGESEDNLNMWWSTTTASNSVHLQNPLPKSAAVTDWQTASVQSHHKNSAIDVHVASPQPQQTSEEVSTSIGTSFSQSRPTVDVGGIHVGQPSVTQFGTVEAVASSRLRPAQAQASVLVTEPPLAPPVPSHLATTSATLNPWMIRQTSPPTSTMLETGGTSLEPVNEEDVLATSIVRSVSRQSTRKSVGSTDAYLGLMTSADVRDELTKKEAELMKLQSIHRSLSGLQQKEDEKQTDDASDGSSNSDIELMAEPMAVVNRSISQNEALLLQQETVRRQSLSAATNLEVLDKEIQELKMMVPARDDFITPTPSQLTSPDATLTRDIGMAARAGSVARQGMPEKGQRAFARMINRETRTDNRPSPLPSRHISISDIPLEAPLKPAGLNSGTRVSEATIQSTETTDSPSMVRSVSAGGAYSHYNVKRDTSYKIGAIGPSVLAEKLKMAKASEERNEAIAGDVVMRQTGKGSVLPRATTLSDQLVTGNQTNYQTTLTDQHSLVPDPTDEFLEMAAKLTPVLPQKMAVLVNRDITQSRTEHSDNDDYIYTPISENKVNSKEVVLMTPKSPAKQAFTAQQELEDKMSSSTDDTFVFHEGGSTGDLSGKTTPGSASDTLGQERKSTASKWQFAAQRTVSKLNRQGADNELEEKLKRRQQLASVTEAIITPITNRKKKQQPHEQHKDGIKI